MDDFQRTRRKALVCPDRYFGMDDICDSRPCWPLREQRLTRSGIGGKPSASPTA
jgi:hypothetical protein